MLNLESVSSGYGPVEVIHSISLSIIKGELVSIIGTNGAGKTTLLRTISALVTCRSGKTIFEDCDITRLPPHKIVELGLVQVPEGRQILAPLTVYENLLLGTYGRRRSFGSHEKEKLFEFVFNLFPILYERKQQIAGTLSGGEQQMLALGRALMAKPKLLLLDEPSLGLAPVVIEDIRRVLLELNSSGLTILLVEQNALLALNLAKRAYVLDVGHIALEGSSLDLLHNDEVKRIYLGEEFETSQDIA